MTIYLQTRIFFCQSKVFVLIINNMQQTSTIMPRKGHQSDKYQGGLHPITKLRHGKGTYTYDNPFFSFQGNYIDGKKNGDGKLIFKDGRVITATFVNDQMVGQAEILYPDGGKYVGELNFGEKQGNGTFESPYESYKGQWKGNCKHGNGLYQNFSTGEKYDGEYSNNKPHGNGKLSKWNYSYNGQFQLGKRTGQGVQISDWPKDEENPLGRYEYQGEFKDDKFQGKGKFTSKDCTYSYAGDFTTNQPNLYPNEFRCFLSNNTKNGEQIVESQKILLNNQAIEYQLQGDSFNLYIQTVYQGPEVLDEIQPTQEQIDAMIKAWQAQNKKNKNPPPMPDFTQPRMKKPQMIVVTQQSGRPIELRLVKQTQGKEDCLKIDYSAEIIAKRKENQEIKLQAAKKAEQDGGKKGGKKDNKGEPELKVLLYKENPSPKEKVLKIATEQGRCHVMKLQFPDDFPASKYWLEIKSSFSGFGEMKAARKELNVKAKQVKKK